MVSRLLVLFNRAKAIRANLWDFDLDFEDICSFGDIKVLMTFEF